MSSVNSSPRTAEFNFLLIRGELVPETRAERFFVFLYSSETPFLHKIGAVALPLILAIAASILMEFSFLGSIVAVVTAAVLTSIFYENGEESLQRRATDAQAERGLRHLDELTQRQRGIQSRYEEAQRRMAEANQRVQAAEARLEETRRLEVQRLSAEATP